MLEVIEWIKNVQGVGKKQWMQQTLDGFVEIVDSILEVEKHE